MPRRCAICGRDVEYGNQVSHSGKRSSRVWAPNLQRVRAVIDGAVRRVRVCTRCLRAGRVQRAV